MTNKPSGTRRYLALWFPFLPADRLKLCRISAGASLPDASAETPPLVLVTKLRGAMRLAAVDEAALALGLSPGLALADARGRVPDLDVRDHDPLADARWLERLCDGCARYTPLVALAPPDGLVLDISGCAHLFGGEAALTADLEARLAGLGMKVRHALASTPDAAHAFARYRPAPRLDEAAAVARLPVAALRLEAGQELVLRRAGLKSVGDVLDRSKGAIAVRIGTAAVTALRRLTGEMDSPLAPRAVVPALVVERRFAEPVASTVYAFATLEGMAVEAAARLEERKGGGRRFEAIFFRADGLARALRVETSLATRDPPAMMRLFRERLESLADPIDPGFGFDMIRFAVPAIEPLAAVQLRLEGGAVADSQAAALIDRLSVRFGRGRLQRFRAQDTHIPEQAQLAFPAVETPVPGAPWRVSERGEPPLRPLHLFDPPQPIEVMAEVPDGPPYRFRWRRALHEVKRFEGPERIASEWWQRKDGKGLTRDYYRVEDARGRRFWIFRHGLYGAEKINPGWFLHGLFA